MSYDKNFGYKVSLRILNAKKWMNIKYAKDKTATKSLDFQSCNPPTKRGALCSLYRPRFTIKASVKANNILIQRRTSKWVGTKFIVYESCSNLSKVRVVWEGQNNLKKIFQLVLKRKLTISTQTRWENKGGIAFDLNFICLGTKVSVYKSCISLFRVRMILEGQINLKKSSS